jgi:hypothetical protein
MIANRERIRDAKREKVKRGEKTHMRYLVADSAVDDVMMGRRLDTRFFVSGESTGHNVNRCAHSKLKNPSISVTQGQ